MDKELKERLEYLRDKSEVCILDKEERYEYEELLSELDNQ